MPRFIVALVLPLSLAACGANQPPGAVEGGGPPIIVWPKEPARPVPGLPGGCEPCIQPPKQDR